MAFTATVCPITRDEFRQHAVELPVQLNGSTLSAEPKEFSTRSLGWNINAKTTVLVNGKPVKVQVGLNVTIIGSKELT